MVIALNHIPEIDKRFQPYYTNSNPIVKYMVDQLELATNDLVLEPCAGEGAFIDEILKTHIDINMTLIELNENANNILASKYLANKKVQILRKNFFYHEDYLNQKFNKIIANPPYGAWIDYDERKILKNKFEAISTKETYGIFLYNAIQLLEENGILVFIIPETFLYLHSHTKLRQYLLQNTLIKELVIFPSSFFPNVNFGYGKLSIITLLKKSIKEDQKHSFSYINNLDSANDLLNIKQKQYFNQYDILHGKDSVFYLTENHVLKNLITTNKKNIGEIADCVTGIYTGNNKKYFGVLSNETKNVQGYNVLTQEEITKKHCSLEGILGKKCFIPVVRGAGQSRFFKKEVWYIDWSDAALRHYKEDRKARFQNTRFYFKKGIAVPMVKTKASTAFLMENSVFEQSVVGIFPKDEKYLLYLLAFFNSETASKIITLINPTANNSANYIKKIPIAIPNNDELCYINNLVELILNTKNFSTILEKKINDFFEKIYKRI